MLTSFQLRSLISASNIASGLLAEHLVRSFQEFESFEDISKGIPILVPADDTVFHFTKEDVFEIPSARLCKVIYGDSSKHYIGFRTTFNGNYFLSSFTVREKFMSDMHFINLENKRVVNHVSELRKKYKKVGAFQTRNIPHFGHQKIIERMLAHCDHLVVNPVLGPKKNGDATIECLNSVFGDFFKLKFDGRVSFMPVYANMYYAGPREAVHHSILRRNMGFTNFTVGRDHAGAENFYDPTAAPELLTNIQNQIDIDIFCHFGAKRCLACDDFVISGECNHSSDLLTDVSGSQFRAALSKGHFFDLADKGMQEYVFANVKDIFEV
jgi:sulfate adenylyltransferase